MRLKRAAAISAVLALGLSALAACGGGEPGTDPTPEPGVSFEAGTTMARLKEAQKITIGTKFDQPGFGLANLDGVPEGFDVEIGKIIATELGIPVENIEWVQTPSAVREEVIETDQVDIVVDEQGHRGRIAGVPQDRRWPDGPGGRSRRPSGHDARMDG